LTECGKGNIQQRDNKAGYQSIELSYTGEKRGGKEERNKNRRGVLDKEK
jgi:hypothetical protein